MRRLLLSILLAFIFISPAHAEPNTPPDRPANVKVTKQGPDSLKLAWDASPGADVYWIYRNNIYIGETADTYYIDSGLRDKRYIYNIRAKNEAGPSLPSAGAVYPPSDNSGSDDPGNDESNDDESNDGENNNDAGTGNDLPPINPPGEPQDPQPSPDPQTPTRDKGGVFERTIASIVEVPIRVIRYIGSAAGMKSIDELVFLSGLSDEEKKMAPWTEKELKFIKLWYLALAGIMIPFFLVAISITAIKLINAGVNPGARAEAIESIWRWFGALGIILLAPLLVQSLLWAVGIILEGIQAGYVLVSQAAGIDRPVSDWREINGSYFDNLVTGSVLGTAIVKAMLVFIYLWLNVIYLIRKLVVTVMLCFTPMMALLWAINRNVNAAGIWLGEIASNAFMPVAHALVLCIVLGFCDVKNVSEGTWFTILVFLYTLLPLAEVLRNSMQGLLTRMSGLNEAQTAKGIMASAIGLGGILSLGRAGGAMFGGSAAASNNVRGGGGLGPVPVRATSGGGIPGPGGAAPTIYSQASTPVPKRQIGFGSPDGVPETDTSSASQPKSNPWSGYAMTAAGITAGAVGGIMHVVSGAVPGGQQVAKTMSGAMQGTARFSVATGTVTAQALHRRVTGQSESIGQAVRDVTGVREDGIKGTFLAMKRAGSVGFAAAKDGSAGLQQLQQFQGIQQADQEDALKPKRVIGFRPPAKGLE